MDDQVLIHILETACAEENLIFQVIEQEGHLHVFLNRGPEQVLDYRTVGKKIYQALGRLSLTDIDGVYLYSRVLGEEEPDWDTKFRLPQSKSQAEQVQPEAQPEQPEPVAQAAKPAQSEMQRRTSEADTYIVRGETAIGAQAAGSAAVRSSTTRSSAAAHAQSPPTQQPAVGNSSTAAVAARSNAVAAPAAEAAQYPLSDKDGATEAAIAYEAAETAAPTVSVVAEAPVEAASKAEDVSESSKAEFDLSEHCFIRNRMLLTADIVPPSKAVSKQINAFHDFSMAEKQQMVPQLLLFFKGAPTFSMAELPEAQQAWFKAAEALKGDDTRKLPIWLSRYCLDSEVTLAVVARVFDPSLGAAKQSDASEAADDAGPESPGHPPQNAEGSSDANARTSGSGGAAHSISGSMAGGTATAPRIAQGRPQSPRAAAAEEASAVSQWLWPGIVVIGSVILMGLGMLLAKPAAMSTGLCSGSDQPEQCQLATQIVGDQETWDGMKENAQPLPANEEMREGALAVMASSCSLNGAINAEHNSLKAFNGEIEASRDPQLEAFLPGLWLADVEYPNAEGPGTVRTACVFSNETIPNRDSTTQPFEMASAVIPVGWPAEAFSNEEAQATEMRLKRAFQPLFTLGYTLLFTTVGLFAAALLRMAVTARNLTALSQAAIAMAVFESFFELLLPLNGLLMFPFIVARKSLALGLTGAVVPGFKVDWSSGYGSVAGCVAVMVLVRSVLRWLLMLLVLGSELVWTAL